MSTPDMWWRKKRPILVTARCPLCGIVEVPIRDVKVSATRNSALLVCPVRGHDLVVLLQPDEDVMLMSHGVEVVL